MSWFRSCSIVFAAWGVAFFILPRFSNELFGVDSTVNLYAEDWTRLIGPTMFGFAYVLDAAHRTSSAEARRIIARGVLLLTVAIAIVMTYWQIIPDGRWNRLDLLNIAILLMMAYGMFGKSGWWGSLRRSTTGAD